jgi:GDP-mannose 6-dehydrogenase
VKIAVFGLGYVGTITAACLASSGHDVWGVDVDASKVAMIAGGRSPVIEPGLEELVAQAVADGSMHATTSASESMAGADCSIICVGTPSSPKGGTELSFVVRAVDEIGEALVASQSPGHFHSVVLRSTVPPGTVEQSVIPTLEEKLGPPAQSGYGAAMCPEFLREGSGVADFFNPPFTVVGTADDRVASAMAELFGFLDDPIRIVAVRSAEGLKYACNAFHANKVAFANELARLFQQLDIDSRTVMELFCEDRQLNISPSYLRPGFAFGGPCLPKDLRALLHLGRMNSVDMPLLSGVMSSNEVTMSTVVDRVTAGAGKTVALLGLSFKMSSDDLRESPNVQLAETLVGKGYTVKIFDPVVNPSRLIGTNLQFVESKLPHLQRFLADSALEALAGVDLAIVSSSDATVVEALLSCPPPKIIDLNGRLGADVEALAGYEGAWW